MIVFATRQKWAFGKIRQIKKGNSETCILTHGPIINIAFEINKKLKKNLSIYSCHTLKPFDEITLKKLFNNYKKIIGSDVAIKNFSSDDNRSYHISSNKILDRLNFKTKFNILDAVQDLKEAFEKKLLFNCLDNEDYFNIKKMNQINLS